MQSSGCRICFCLCPDVFDGALTQGWNVVVVGHSLGAGTAALLAMLLQEDIQKAHEQQQGQLEGGTTVAPDPLEALAVLSLSSDSDTGAKRTAAVSLHQQHQKKGSILCWAFACPPVVSQNLAAQCADLVRSVVLQVRNPKTWRSNQLAHVVASSWATPRLQDAHTGTAVYISFPSGIFSFRQIVLQAQASRPLLCLCCFLRTSA